MQRVLVANRGAVADRVIRALAKLEIESVAVYSDADRDAPYLERATSCVRLGPANATESYLNIDAVLAAMERSGSDGLHPGYGFLAENADFARRVRSLGAVWIGPDPMWIERMGHKTRGRTFARQQDLPVGSASEVIRLDDRDSILALGDSLGYPVLVKPAEGGGGIGMLPATSPEQLVDAVERASAVAGRAFGARDVYLERMAERPRHVEFQLVGDQYGNVKHLFERDCSVQRRHQKVLEEAPAPGIPPEVLDSMADRLVEAFRGYDNVGTIEMLHDHSEGIRFLEMNTRLQVEHGVTEEITGVDLVTTQIRLAAGEPLASAIPSRVSRRGHAIEARIYAEDPIRFLPSPGQLETFRPPSSARVETGYREGQEVTPYYDPLLAKVIGRGSVRSEAIRNLEAALEEFEIKGVRNTIPALLTLIRSDAFRAGHVHTDLVNEVLARTGGK